MSKLKSKREIYGEIMIDSAKLIFAGVVLAGIFETDFNKSYLVILGLLFCFIFIIIEFLY